MYASSFWRGQVAAPNVGTSNVHVRRGRATALIFHLKMMMRHSLPTLSVVIIIIASSITSPSYAFVRPSSSTLLTIGRRNSVVRGGGAVASQQPRDLLPVDLRLEKAYALSGTLRWERRWDVLRWDRRSTITSSDEEMSSTTTGFDEDETKSGVGGGGESGGPPMNVPEFPEMMSNGIYEIINADQHK